MIYKLFSCSPNIPRGFNHAGKPRESVVYCLGKSKGEFDMIKDQSITIIIIYYMISEEWCSCGNITIKFN